MKFKLKQFKKDSEDQENKEFKRDNQNFYILE